MKETEITIKVKLDSNNIPEEIYWSAPDGGMKDEQSKAILLSFWDSAKKETLKMDLWTKEMPIDEMKSFMLHYKHICAPQAAYYYIPLHCLMLDSSLIYNILHCLMLRDSILYHVISHYIVFILHDISLDWLIS